MAVHTFFYVQIRTQKSIMLKCTCKQCIIVIIMLFPLAVLNFCMLIFHHHTYYTHNNKMCFPTHGPQDTRKPQILNLVIITCRSLHEYSSSMRICQYSESVATNITKYGVNCSVFVLFTIFSQSSHLFWICMHCCFFLRCTVYTACIASGRSQITRIL